MFGKSQTSSDRFFIPPWHHNIAMPNQALAMKPKNKDLVLFPILNQYVQTLDLNQLPAARKTLLDDLAHFLQRSHTTDNPLNLVFICTHNSRRSQFGQIWAAVAAAYYGIQGLGCFSGGTEVTAFNPRAVAALQRVGLQLSPKMSSDNPHYTVRFAEGYPDLVCFSKVYDDAHNPKQEVVAMMTCDEADKNCPMIPGAVQRVALNYHDPKVADDTPQEVARYDERCRQIATEMFYLFHQITL